MAENWYSDEAATFGDRLTAAREAADLSAEELAKRLGVRLSTIGKWEEDLSEPRANRLQMLAGMLGVSLIWLLTGEGEGPEPPHEDEGQDRERHEVSVIRAEMRGLRLEIVGLAGRLGQLERRLRNAGSGR
ncbi:MAG: helix-turn-helix domain-containing protein [Rubellimicrobium sp.]|nr:helix-turn-helix domain-containing protein [Rubellimicrobium sp.]